jgi:EAL domain-containing protein (putative c-di-GMP-specific phosphodiesterase class I)
MSMSNTEKHLKDIRRMTRDLGIEIISDGISMDKEITLVKSLGTDALMGKHIGSPMSMLKPEQRGPVQPSKQKD